MSKEEKDLIVLRKLVDELISENFKLKSDLAYLKGEVGVYERFLRSKGYLKDV